MVERACHVLFAPCATNTIPEPYCTIAAEFTFASGELPPTSITTVFPDFVALIVDNGAPSGLTGLHASNNAAPNDALPASAKLFAAVIIKSLLDNDIFLNIMTLD